MNFKLCIPCGSSSSSSICCKRSPSNSLDGSDKSKSFNKYKNNSQIPSIFKPIHIDSPPVLIKNPNYTTAEYQKSSLIPNIEILKKSENINIIKYYDDMSSITTSKSSYSISSLYGLDLNDDDENKLIKPLLLLDRSASDFFISRNKESEEQLQLSHLQFDTLKSKSLEFIQLNLKHIDSDTSSEITNIGNSFISNSIIITSLDDKQLVVPSYKTCININIPSNGYFQNITDQLQLCQNSDNYIEKFKFPYYKGMGRIDYRIFKPETCKNTIDFHNKNNTTKIIKLTEFNSNINNITNFNNNYTNSEINNINKLSILHLPPSTTSPINTIESESDIYFSNSPSPNLSIFSNETHINVILNEIYPPDEEKKLTDDEYQSMEQIDLSNVTNEIVNYTLESDVKFKQQFDVDTGEQISFLSETNIVPISNITTITDEQLKITKNDSLMDDGNLKLQLKSQRENKCHTESIKKVLTKFKTDSFIPIYTMATNKPKDIKSMKMMISDYHGIKDRNVNSNLDMKRKHPNEYVSLEIEKNIDDSEIEIQERNKFEAKDGYAVGEIESRKSRHFLEIVNTDPLSSQNIYDYADPIQILTENSILNNAIYEEIENFPNKPIEMSQLISSLKRLKEYRIGNELLNKNTLITISTLLESKEFQKVLSIHNKIQNKLYFNSPSIPTCTHLYQLAQDCIPILCNSSPATRQLSYELVNLLNKTYFENLFYTHDEISEKELQQLPIETSLNFGLPADGNIIINSTNHKNISSFDQSKSQPNYHIELIQIMKTNDPLGVTVRNEDEKIIVGRIITGGIVEKSGLLHEGDEILKINNIEMKGKSINEICNILSEMFGILTLLIIPAKVQKKIKEECNKNILVHVRANFNYDPEDDIFLPCRELGIRFQKCDILHVINQDDTNWWQARREGEEDTLLAGLIPSKSFQEQRESIRQMSLLDEMELGDKLSKSTLLCTKIDKKLRKKKMSYSTSFNEDIPELISTYEEVTLYYPNSNFKRPIILIGPPNVGRHELRQMLIIREPHNFASPIPYTTRQSKIGELDGHDYNFITRTQFESDILCRKFVEYGEFEKSHYGISLNSIKSIISAKKTCILNIYPQSIKILRTYDIKPYIIFIAPPPIERLKQMRLLKGESCKEDDLITLINKAKEMELKFGHYFDTIIINNDYELTYRELLQIVNYIEREPQWVPTFWLKEK